MERCERKVVELSVLARRSTSGELPIFVSLVVALPKGERQRYLVEKAVELGTGRLQPVETQRSVVQLAPRALQRLARTVVEASKQCGRSRLMEIAQPLSWDEMLARTQQDRQGEKLLAHPGGKALNPPAALGAQAVTIAIGPEGGFSEDEVDRARAHSWKVVDLGPNLLRVETAAIAAVSSIVMAVRANAAGNSNK